SIGVSRVAWNATEGVSVGMYEKLLILRSDSTYVSRMNYTDPGQQERRDGFWGLENSGAEGAWLVAGDTFYTNARRSALRSLHKGSNGQITRSGQNKFTLQWTYSGSPGEFERA